jgi:hypothetical protein
MDSKQLFWIGIQSPSHAGQKVYLRAPVKKNIIRFLDSCCWVGRIKRVGIEDGELIGWMFSREAMKEVETFLKESGYTAATN